MADSINLVELNKFLEENSYITGFQPSQNDTIVFDHLETKSWKDHCHIRRWFNHILSFGLERKKFPPAAEGCPFFDISLLKGTNNEVTEFVLTGMFVLFYFWIIAYLSWIHSSA